MATAKSDMDEKDARAVDGALADLRTLHGHRLRAVVLHGEAATEAYLPWRSPLALAVVVDAVTPAVLRSTASYVARWRRRRIDVPLLFDPPYIASARDVFPLEFLDLADRHRVLLGDDPFADMPVNLAALRTEIEAQLRGKLLHLHEAYLESGGSRAALRALLIESEPAFEIVMRGMLRLRDSARPAKPAALLPAIEHAFGVALPVLRELAAARAGDRALHRSELEPLFERYLDEVRALVGAADSL